MKVQRRRRFSVRLSVAFKGEKITVKLFWAPKANLLILSDPTHYCINPSHVCLCFIFLWSPMDIIVYSVPFIISPKHQTLCPTVVEIVVSVDENLPNRTMTGEWEVTKMCEKGPRKEDFLNRYSFKNKNKSNRFVCCNSFQILNFQNWV